MADFGFELEDIARLIKLVETRGLTELVVEEEGRRIVIRGASYRSARPAPAQAEAIIAQPGAQAAPALPEQAAPAEENLVTIRSPMIGVFYRASGPDAPNFAEVGDHVEVGQTVGLIEAMKVFSEVPSDYAGTVMEIPADNGKLVKVDEPLIRIKPD